MASGGAIRPKPRLAPLPPPVSYHRLRKTVHALCFLIFLALPFLNVVRFDIPRQRFYFAGREVWINEFAIIFFSLMFLMFLVTAMAILYGRIYCGYLCPQMIFSEFFARLEKRWGRVRFYLALLPASVLLAFVFIAYFVEPADLFRRLIALDVHTAGGIAGAAVTLIAFLDFAFVRQGFCKTVCPYGYLQGFLADGHTLLVAYQDPAADCIECKKCVRVCQMGIDIRKSPHQIECVHCGDCIDACEQVLRRLGKPGLIHYIGGGLRDAKRVVILLVLLFYATGLFVALKTRRPVLVQVAPERATLYRAGADGRIYNQFRFRVANRGRDTARVNFTAHGLPGAEVLQAPVVAAPGAAVEGRFEIAAPPGARDVNHFTIRAGEESFPMTFLMPAQRSAQ